MVRGVKGGLVRSVEDSEALLPQPNVAGAGIVNNYRASGSGISNNDQFDVRADNTSKNLHVFGKYSYFKSSLTGAPYFGAAGGGFGAGSFAGNDNAFDQSVSAGGDYTVSPAWLTDFRFGWFVSHQRARAELQTALGQ